MLRRLARSSRGSTIVEFALIFPLLMTLGFAVWEFGRLYDAKIIATNAAREGARYAAAHSSDSNLASETRTFVYNYATSGYGSRLGSSGDVSLTSASVQVVFISPSGQSGSTAGVDYQVKVTVPVQAKVFTPFVPGLKNPETLTGVATMKLQ